MFINSPHMYALENASKPFGLRHTSNSPVALGPRLAEDVSCGMMIPITTNNSFFIAVDY